MKKFMPSHEIRVSSYGSTLVMPVMLSDGNLWQRSEYERNCPSALWQYHHGVLTFWNGVMPSGATVIVISPSPMEGEMAKHETTIESVISASAKAGAK